MTGNIELVFVLIALIVFFILRERKIKKEMKSKFKQFSNNNTLEKNDLRTVPRILIPNSMGVLLYFKGEPLSKLNSRIIDMSLSGFLIKPNFPLKRLPVNLLVNNIRVDTPINTFHVEQIKTVNAKNHEEAHLMALHIEKINPEEFEKLKTFMKYLDNFLKNDN